MRISNINRRQNETQHGDVEALLTRQTIIKSTVVSATQQAKKDNTKYYVYTEITFWNNNAPQLCNIFIFFPVTLNPLKFCTSTNFLLICKGRIDRWFNNFRISFHMLGVNRSRMGTDMPVEITYPPRGPSGSDCSQRALQSMLSALELMQIKPCGWGKRMRRPVTHISLKETFQTITWANRLNQARVYPYQAF